MYLPLKNCTLFTYLIHENKSVGKERSSRHFRETFNWLYISPRFLLKYVLFLSQPAQLQTTTLCYINTLGPDQKRRTADSFAVNKPSVSPKKWSSRLVNFTAVDSCWQLLTDHWLVCGGDARDNKSLRCCLRSDKLVNCHMFENSTLSIFKLQRV